MQKYVSWTERSDSRGEARPRDATSIATLLTPRVNSCLSSNEMPGERVGSALYSIVLDDAQALLDPCCGHEAYEFPHRFFRGSAVASLKDSASIFVAGTLKPTMVTADAVA